MPQRVKSKPLDPKKQRREEVKARKKADKKNSPTVASSSSQPNSDATSSNTQSLTLNPASSRQELLHSLIAQDATQTILTNPAVGNLFQDFHEQWQNTAPENRLQSSVQFMIEHQQNEQAKAVYEKLGIPFASVKGLTAEEKLRFSSLFTELDHFNTGDFKKSFKEASPSKKKGIFLDFCKKASEMQLFQFFGNPFVNSESTTQSDMIMTSEDKQDPVIIAFLNVMKTQDKKMYDQFMPVFSEMVQDPAFCEDWLKDLPQEASSHLPRIGLLNQLVKQHRCSSHFSHLLDLIQTFPKLAKTLPSDKIAEFEKFIHFYEALLNHHDALTQEERADERHLSTPEETIEVLRQTEANLLDFIKKIDDYEKKFSTHHFTAGFNQYLLEKELAQEADPLEDTLSKGTTSQTQETPHDKSSSLEQKTEKLKDQSTKLAQKNPGHLKQKYLASDLPYPALPVADEGALNSLFQIFDNLQLYQRSDLPETHQKAETAFEAGHYDDFVMSFHNNTVLSSIFQNGGIAFPRQADKGAFWNYLGTNDHHTFSSEKPEAEAPDFKTFFEKGKVDVKVEERFADALLATQQGREKFVSNPVMTFFPPENGRGKDLKPVIPISIPVVQQQSDKTEWKHEPIDTGKSFHLLSFFQPDKHVLTRDPSGKPSSVYLQPFNFFPSVLPIEKRIASRGLKYAPAIFSTADGKGKLGVIGNAPKDKSLKELYDDFREHYFPQNTATAHETGS